MFVFFFCKKSKYGHVQNNILACSIGWPASIAIIKIWATPLTGLARDGESGLAQLPGWFDAIQSEMFLLMKFIPSFPNLQTFPAPWVDGT